MKSTARVLAACVLALVASATVARAQEVPGKGVTMPRVVRDVKPSYTPEARKERIQGRVELSVVVNDDGTVGEVAVTKSLGYGLDEQAVIAMKQWEFKPGTKDGKPVAVRVNVEMTFTLK